MTVSVSETSSVVENDSDDEFDWEEVQVPLQLPPTDQPIISEPGPSTTPYTIEITLEARKNSKDKDPKKKALNAALYAERVARVNSHKLHTLCLIANGLMRNNWINDKLLHARLMSLTPLSIQNSFLMIHKSRIPEAPKRGRVFETSIMRLVEWWSQEFFRVEMTGHIRSKTFEEVQQSLAAGDFEFDSDGALVYGRDDGRGDYEIIKSSKSLMKHALMRRGSRDVSAQLFTALCRALGIPARLVVSLQSVPWKAGVGRPKQSGKKKAVTKSGDTKVVNEGDTDDGDDMEEVSIPTSADIKGKSKAVDMQDGFMLDEPLSDSQQQLGAKAKRKQKAPPVINLRKPRPKTQLPDSMPSRAVTPDPTTSPPVFWTEVFSRPDGRWLPVDPIRAIVNKRKVFDPSSTATNKVKQENRMLYVLAFEEDGFARDVTPRYAKEYGAKVAKMQRGGKSRKEWWEEVLGLVRRPYRLNRDDVEDEELQSVQLTEGMPTSMIGFKDHPLYVLARHLKREEVIHPLVELGKFRGEPVYPRGNVLSLKTAENWTRQGYKIREGCQPMKWVKQRAVTVNKKRAVEMALAEQEQQGGGQGHEDGIMQGLYAMNQTELYIPDPIVDGIIPKNNFGNIDLYVPSMLPRGAAFIPHKGAAKVARQLGFDYAEAVTSFEFKNRRAIPVISGVVVAAENESTILEAYWQAEHHRAEKEELKRRADVLKRWTRLVQGLRIRQRVLEQYKEKDQQHSDPQGGDHELNAELELPGGFLTAVAGVIQHYSLPRNPHETLHSNRSSPAADIDIGPDSDHDVHDHEMSSTFAFTQVEEEGSEEDRMDEIATLSPVKPNGVIKTMQELAETAGLRQSSLRRGPQLDGGERSISPSLNSSTPVSKGGRGKANRKSTNTGSRSASTPNSSSRPRKRAREESSPSDTDQEPSKRISPVKRTRAPRAISPPIPASDRVLRKRRAKNTAQVEAEKEKEAAYRRAVEE